LREIYNALETDQRFKPYAKPLEGLLNQYHSNLLPLPSLTSTFGLRRVLLIVLLDAVEKVLEIKELEPNSIPNIKLSICQSKEVANLVRFTVENECIEKGVEPTDQFSQDHVLARSILEELGKFHSKEGSGNKSSLVTKIHNGVRTTTVTMCFGSK
jgi:hypothetical protein